MTQKPCPAFPDKIAHDTRDSALEHMKRLVFRNATTNQGDESRGLHVYECEACGAWHVGHAPAPALVWHYAAATLLDTVLDTGELPVPEPRAYLPMKDDIRRAGSDTRHCFVPLSKQFLKRYAAKSPERYRVFLPELGDTVALSKDLVVRHPVIWFSRDERWDYLMSATPAMQIGRAAMEVAGQGLVRFGVLPSLAPLRWNDYVRMNPLSDETQIRMEFAAEPGNWLASKAPIPCEQIRRIEVYFNGAWTSVTDVAPDAFEQYVAGRRAVYEAAYTSMRRKRSERDQTAPSSLSRHLTLRPQMTIRKLIDWKAEQLDLTEAERIVYEDTAILEILEPRASS